jgi:hypothetical protein
MRAPRVIDDDGLLRAYDEHIDEGRYFAHRLAAGAYRWHCDVSTRRSLLISDVNVLLLGVHRVEGEFADVWRVPLRTLRANKLLVERTGRRHAPSSSSSSAPNSGGSIVLISTTENGERVFRYDDCCSKGVCVCFHHNKFEIASMWKEMMY